MKRTYNLSELESVAREILDQTKSTVLLFNGEMGAGKTTLIKAIASALNVKESVSSPTFSIVNEYKSERWKDDLPF